MVRGTLYLCLATWQETRLSSSSPVYRHQHIGPAAAYLSQRGGFRSRRRDSRRLPSSSVMVRRRERPFPAQGFMTFIQQRI
jgi:hypothetical protein